MPWSTVLPQAVFTSPILSVAAPIAAGTFIGFQTNKQSRTKSIYRNLHKPPLYPPAWLFGPVWTILYGLMGFAAHHATVTGTTVSPLASSSLQQWTVHSQHLYASQLLLNYLWMPLFFGLRKPAWALADMLLLAGNVAALMHAWYRHDRPAFWMLVPYAAWLGFATYLNAGVGVLNRWTIGDGEGEGEGEAKKEE